MLYIKITLIFYQSLTCLGQTDIVIRLGIPGSGHTLYALYRGYLSFGVVLLLCMLPRPSVEAMRSAGYSAY